MNNSLNLVGYASGIAANNPDCALGPWYLYYHADMLQQLTMTTTWQTIIKATSKQKGADVLSLVTKSLTELSEAVLPLARHKQPFCVIGGDHSCAMGTWSAVAHAHRPQGDIGLLWIDAHMDSHTAESSPSQNIHGMPLAHLLGFGDRALYSILDSQPKIKPENVCLIGIRSYEAHERELLERLGIKIYYMHDVLEQGLDAIFTKACQQVSAGTCGFGITIDLDGIDPVDAPGVGCREAGGIRSAELLQALQNMKYKQHLLGLEIAEFNPMRDETAKTAKLLIDLIQAIYGSSRKHPWS